MTSFLRFTVMTSFILVAIVTSAKIPQKTYSMDAAPKQVTLDLQFLIQLLRRISELETEAKEIHNDYLQLLHEGAHLPEDKVLSLNLLADDLDDDESEPIVGKPHNSGADTWVRATVTPINSSGNNRSAIGK